ncbi:hypothetical protein D3C84_1067500 [compost metagenome]
MRHTRVCDAPCDIESLSTDERTHASIGELQYIRSRVRLYESCKVQSSDERAMSDETAIAFYLGSVIKVVVNAMTVEGHC